MSPVADSQGADGDFKTYAEQVFIEQNQVLDELMYLTEYDLSPTEYALILDAEKKLLDACELLNEYAVYEIEGKTMSWYFQNKVKNSVSGCAEMISEVETLLENQQIYP